MVDRKEALLAASLALKYRDSISALREKLFEGDKKLIELKKKLIDIQSKIADEEQRTYKYFDAERRLRRKLSDLEDEIGRLALSDSLYKGNATSLNQMRRLIRLYDRYQDNLRRAIQLRKRKTVKLQRLRKIERDIKEEIRTLKEAQEEALDRLAHLLEQMSDEDEHIIDVEGGRSVS